MLASVRSPEGEKIETICGVEHIVIKRWDGTQSWWLNGARNKLHRENGPALIHSSGKKSWFLNGEKLSETEFNQYVANRRIKALL